jgi:uncharacterized protein YueI
MDRVTSDLHEAQIAFQHYYFQDMLAIQKKKKNPIHVEDYMQISLKYTDYVYILELH